MEYWSHGVMGMTFPGISGWSKHLGHTDLNFFMFNYIRGANG